MKTSCITSPNIYIFEGDRRERVWRFLKCTLIQVNNFMGEVLFRSFVSWGKKHTQCSITVFITFPLSNEGVFLFQMWDWVCTLAPPSLTPPPCPTRRPRLWFSTRDFLLDSMALISFMTPMGVPTLRLRTTGPELGTTPFFSFSAKPWKRDWTGKMYCFEDPFYFIFICHCFKLVHCARSDLSCTDCKM